MFYQLYRLQPEECTCYITNTAVSSREYMLVEQFEFIFESSSLIEKNL